MNCGHSNHESQVRCYYCDIEKVPFATFKEVDPDVRDFIIHALEPAIEQLQVLVDADFRNRNPRYIIVPSKDTKLALKPVIEHLQSVVDCFTSVPKFIDEMKNGLLKRKRK